MIGWPRQLGRLTWLMIVALVAAGCAPGGDPTPERSEGSPASAQSPAALPSTPTVAPTPSQASPPTTPTPSQASTPTTPTPTRAPDPFSLPALFDEPLGDPGLTIVRVLAQRPDLTRYQISYRSDGLSISGTLTKPPGTGPFPAVVTNHGLIDPAVYTVGQGLVREEEALVRAGYVTFHSDYRGYGASDPVDQVDHELRLGYTRDVMQAVRAVRSLDYVDGRVAMVGRSMGAGLALNVLVARPGLVSSAMLLSPTSSDIVDNLEGISSAGGRAAIYGRFGTPGESPGFYRALSASTFVDRITEPVAIQHGDSDDVCPLAWSERTVALLRGAGVDAGLSVYEGEEHVFGASYEQSIRETVAFVAANLPSS